MRQWLIQDGTYTLGSVRNIIEELNVQYNEETQQAEVVGYLDLRYLTSADGLKLPDSIGDGIFGLNLSSFTSAEGLELPDSVGGGLYFNGLTSAEREHLRVQRPDLADKILPPDIM